MRSLSVAEVKVSATLGEALPLLTRIWNWTTEHYVQVGIFVLCLMALVVLGRRRS